MTEDQAEKVIRTFLAEGGSVCPFAKTCPVFFFRSNVDPVPMLNNFGKGQALIAFTPVALGGFAATQEWARQTFLALLTAAALASNPGTRARDVRAEVKGTIKPLLYDTNPLSLRPNIALWGAPVITVCMAPCYPKTHPRYAPVALLVMTWASDVESAGTFPKVREAMRREHGFVYDAMDLVLPLPRTD